MTIALAWSASANAGCETDMDCQGDHICVEGSCQDPGPSTSVPASVQVAQISAEQRAELDQIIKRSELGCWGAGGLGLLGLGLGATVSIDYGLPQVLQFGTLATAATMVPLTARSGKQARAFGRTYGLRPPRTALRTWSWIGYGLSVANGVALFARGVSDEDMEDIYPLAVGAVVLGGLSCLGMSADARRAVDQFEYELSHGTTSQAAPTPALDVTPVFAVNHEQLTLGVWATF